MAEKSVVEMVRDKINAGTLPLDEPLKLWAGAGSGKPCSACEQPILPAQTEFEPQYYDERIRVSLHVGCHGLWEAERIRRGYRPKPR